MWRYYFTLQGNFQPQRPCSVLSSASSQVTKPCTALQFNTPPSSCEHGQSELWISKIFLERLLKWALDLDSTWFFRMELRTTGKSSWCQAKPNRNLWAEQRSAEPSLRTSTHVHEWFAWWKGEQNLSFSISLNKITSYFSFIEPAHKQDENQQTC